MSTTRNAPMSHGEFLALKRFPALDGVRAIAALLVVFFHNDGPGLLQGWLGVQVFFVLSGFLITTLLLREHSRTGRINLPSFYRRRAFRILPVYFVVLFLTAAGLLVAGQFGSNPLGRDFGLYLVFFNEFGLGGPYGHSWSLGIEQKFYLLWPLLAFTLLPRARPLVTAGLMTLSLAVIPFTVAVDPKGWSVHYFTVLIGCLLAMIMHNPRGYAVFKPLTRPWVAGAVCLLFLGAHLSVSTLSDLLDKAVFDIPGFVAVVPFYALAAALLMPALLGPGLPQRLLSTRVMVYLGERSYSIYLVQSIAHGIVVGLAPGASGLLLAVPVSLVAIGIADLCYRWVERPMIALGRRREAKAVPAPEPVGHTAEPK
ncbi:MULTISPECIES: acyltransferase [unclassified Crossiella]|uniref:acyltransferase family protein n=1 Tax=unclassified Crossiella TaxID=2620835 RepID=UPI001FFF7715|nr:MULTISPECIES: acyltransferase [unclassified Crossiella]MCK2237453.1 acyltransferase [Crossiella sp. S99.2]MCK2251108.1 acyltransferase [Crossiella sp. S99.1]